MKDIFERFKGMEVVELDDLEEEEVISDEAMVVGKLSVTSVEEAIRYPWMQVFTSQIKGTSKNVFMFHFNEKSKAD